LCLDFSVGLCCCGSSTSSLVLCFSFLVDGEE
jgi:hypothetical protein